MKKILYFVILLIAFSLTSGCYPLSPNYSQQDAELISQKGSELMKEWLEKNMPDAQLRECNADSLMSMVDGNKYLTGYAYGSIQDKDKIIDFAIDTNTAEVYFKMDQDRQHELEQAMSSYLYECMGIEQQYGDGFACSIMAPSYDKNHFDFFDYGLPSGVNNLDEFVRNPASRPLIHISKAQISIIEDIDISKFSLEAFEELSERCGARIDGLAMTNNRQTVTFSNGNAGFYEYGILLEGNDYALWGAIHVKQQIRDISTNKITVSDYSFNPQLDLNFKETETGFEFDFPNDCWGQSFRFYAKENSDLIFHDYIYYYGDSKSTISWKEQSQGIYVMVSENQMIMDFNLGGVLKRVE